MEKMRTWEDQRKFNSGYLILFSQSYDQEPVLLFNFYKNRKLFYKFAHNKECDSYSHNLCILHFRFCIAVSVCVSVCLRGQKNICTATKYSYVPLLSKILHVACVDLNRECFFSSQKIQQNHSYQSCEGQLCYFYSQ